MTKAASGHVFSVTAPRTGIDSDGRRRQRTRSRCRARESALSGDVRRPASTATWLLLSRTGARFTQPGELAPGAAGALRAGLGAHHQGDQSARLIFSTP